MERYLMHHGILGMHWGVRRYQNEDGTLTEAGKKHYQFNDRVTTKNGESLDISKKQKSLKDSMDYDAYVNGKKVGNLFLEDNGDSLYINWIDVKSSERGKGYANALMDYTIDYAKSNGYKYCTLEVPGSSPDARHIYEKKGFEVDSDSSVANNSNDVWDGLTAMKKKL